jgi:hypothetical protein
LTRIADAWRPFRMWAFVLVRLWHGRTSAGSRRQGRSVSASSPGGPAATGGPGRAVTPRRRG